MLIDSPENVNRLLFSCKTPFFGVCLVQCNAIPSPGGKVDFSLVCVKQGKKTDEECGGIGESLYLVGAFRFLPAFLTCPFGAPSPRERVENV